MESLSQYEAVRLDRSAGEMLVLDQTLLPNEVKILHLRDQDAVWEAINVLRVRGAPAIGIAAGYGVYLAARNSGARDYEHLLADFLRAKQYLASATRFL